MQEVINRLSVLAKEKQLTFGLLAAERFFICYKIFSLQEGFGNIIPLMESMEVIENIALGKSTDLNAIKSLREKVDKNIPDMDDFGSVNGSLALNVGCIIYETLSLIMSKESRILTDISTYCTDSIDFLILEIEEYDQMELEKISNHYLMQEELELQKGIVNYLERIPELELADIDTLRQLQAATKFSKLNLEKIFAE